MTMRIRHLLAAAAVAALASGFSTTSFAAKTLRMSSQWTETTAGAQVDKWWAKEIEARTNGEIKIKIFWEGVLGKAKENLALIQNGSIDLAAMSPGYFPAELPFHAAPNSIPMAMARVEQATELMERLLTEVPEFDEEAKRNGMKALFFHHLNPYLLVCKEPVAGVDDMQGKKVRTWGKDMPRMVQAAGGVAVTLSLPELYEGLGRGTVDCIPFSVDLMVNYKIYEVAKHVHDITLWEGPTNAVWIARGGLGRHDARAAEGRSGGLVRGRIPGSGPGGRSRRGGDRRAEGEGRAVPRLPRRREEALEGRQPRLLRRLHRGHEGGGAWRRCDEDHRGLARGGRRLS